ncbi:hypothetical protein PMAYCL1PPCAC_31854, partial [Pristionchus mayeri]
MENICPSGILHLGYADTYFPYFYFDDIRVRGVSIELWKIVSKAFNCSSMSLAKYSDTAHEDAMANEGWEFTDKANLAAIKRADIFADLTMNTLSQSRVQDFRFTTDIAIDQLSFYEAINTTTAEESWTPYSFFVVFSAEIFALIIIFAIIMNLIGIANNRLQSPPGLVIRYFVLGLFSVSIMTLFFIHAAVFKGNMIITVQPKLMLWNDVIVGLKSGSLNLLESVAIFEVSRSTAILVNLEILVKPCYDSQVSRLCSKPSSTIAVLHKSQILFIADNNLLPAHCLLQRIPPQGNATIIAERFMPSNFLFVLPRNTTRKTVNKINQIILKMFSYEKV